MVLQIPQLHNFSPSIIEAILEETECQSVPDWEISVQQKDDIAWSVVLSYLISPYHRNKEDFARRLWQLTGSDKNWKLVRKAIESFNPFKNRYSCFYNTTLKQVVEEFKIKLNWNSLPSVSSKLEVVSATLRCPVVSMWKDENNIKKHIYSKHTNHFQGIIMLYSCYDNSEGNENSKIVYNFLLDHQLGLKMKKAALLYFLKEAKLFEKEIRRIESCVKKGQHFLISLLTSGYQDIIPKLYKSSYVVSKLNEAGYETDPRTRDDNGLSALHHALVLGNLKTLYALYYFSANNCVQSECSYRNPDCSILINLHQIENILSDDRAKVKYHPNYDNLKKTSDDLLGLNKFLIEVNKKIIKIKNELNYYESTNETVFEARKRRDIIVSVLETYQEFFKPIQKECTNLSPLDDYVKFKNYYNLIDMTTAIIFFDNIALLKERLVLNDKNQFSEIESSFLFSVIYHVVFENKETIPFIAPKDINSLYLFPLMNRLENKNKIEEFSKNLRDTDINEDNVVKLIPRSEIFNILNSHPVFKDHMHLKRLKKYIKTAVNITVTDVKSVLVIQRTLHVIGEYISLDDSNDYSFRRFLCLILPKEVSQILRRTRNELSHVKNYMFKSKFECEKNFSLFRSIQKEIRLIQFHFRPVFQIHDLYKYIVLMKVVRKQLEQIREQPHLYAASPLYSQDIRIELNIQLKHYHDFFLSKYGSAVEEMLKTVLDYVENISSEINWNDNCGNLKKKILYALWPLKWTIEILKECGKTNAETPLNDFKELENCNPDTDSIEDLKIKTSNCLTKCKNLLSMLNIKRKRVIRRLEEINSIGQFLKILKGFIYLSNEERDGIRQEIPETIKQSVIFKEKLIKSIKDGFTLKIEEITSEFEASYLSNNKKKLFLKYYQNNSTESLAILETPDPIFELEEIFSKNSVDKKKYETLCKTMQLSDQSKKILGRLVAGQNQKNPGNNMLNLLNRVQLLKKILIEENGEVHNLWLKIKRPSSRIHVVDTILWYYLRDSQLQAAVEMLLFDCMSIYEKESKVANPWIKSSKFYCGINLRNVISHGSPLLECLCALLDPEDLPSEMIQKILRLIEDEDSIKAILELYEQVGNDYSKLLEVINSNGKDEYIDIKHRILKCDTWKHYVLLLPFESKPSKNK